MDQLSREELLAILDSLTMGELGAVVNRTVFCRFLINPWDKRIMFDGEISKIIGPAADEDMLLTQFFQYIPEEDRLSVTARYNDSISELLTGNYESAEIRHSIKKNEYDHITVNSCFQVIKLDQTRYITGFMED